MLRNDIENFYETQWSKIVSPKTKELLIELTCKEYKLSQPKIPGLVKQEDYQRPHNLGKI